MAAGPLHITEIVKTMKINHLIVFLLLLAATSCASTRKSTEINPPFVASESTWSAVYHLGIPIQPGRFGGYERRGDLRGFAGACAACGGEQKEKYDEMIDFHGFGFYV